MISIFPLKTFHLHVYSAIF